MIKDEIMALAASCEAADCALFVLDGKIAAALGYPGFPPPAYTGSIDAAMSLVPSEMRDEIEITTLYQVARVGINLNHGPDDGPYYASNQCNSIPLALCAAALKARTSTMGEGE